MYPAVVASVHGDRSIRASGSRLEPGRGSIVGGPRPVAVGVSELDEAMHHADPAGGVVINDQRDTFGLEEPEATALAVWSGSSVPSVSSSNVSALTNLTSLIRAV